MPIFLPSSIQQAAEEPARSRPYIWLWELQVYDGDEVLPPIVFRATSYHEPVQWPQALTAPPQVEWFPFGFEFSEIEEGKEGDLPQAELSLDNTTRLLSRYLHEFHGFEGQRATLFLVTEEGLAVPYPDHEFLRWDFRVAAASASGDAVTLRLEQPNFLQRKLPQDRYVAHRCRWPFGGQECGYIVNAVAAFTTCGKTVADCVARGDDERLRGLPVLHPRRFGGFPGIPRQRNL